MKAHHSLATKSSKKSKRRAMDETYGRQAQLWWMLGVGVLLLLTAYYENIRPLQPGSQRGPAQISSAAPLGLPYSQGQFK